MVNTYVPVLESDLRAAIAIIKNTETPATPDLTVFRERLTRYLSLNPNMTWDQYKAFVESSRTKETA